MSFIYIFLFVLFIFTFSNSEKIIVFAFLIVFSSLFVLNNQVLVPVFNRVAEDINLNLRVYFSYLFFNLEKMQHEYLFRLIEISFLLDILFVLYYSLLKYKTSYFGCFGFFSKCVLFDDVNASVSCLDSNIILMRVYTLFLLGLMSYLAESEFDYIGVNQLCVRFFSLDKQNICF